MENEKMEFVDTSELDMVDFKVLEELTAEEFMEATKDDRCPHCMSNPHEYPYITYASNLGWLECTSCGTVFCPLSRRIRKKQFVQRQKEKGPSLIEVPEVKIATPKLILP